MSETRKVLDFIKLIKDLGTSEIDMVDLCTNGKCYRFALILRDRFPNSEIWYDIVEGHVYTKIGKVWFDIRGAHYKVSEFCDRLDHYYGHRPHRWDSDM